MIKSGELKKLLAEKKDGKKKQASKLSKVQKNIKENPVLVYSLTTCPHCIQAKNLLDKEGIKAKIINLDSLPGDERQKTIDEIKKITGQDGVPQAWVKGKYVKGYAVGLEKMIKSGELKKLLAEKKDGKKKQNTNSVKTSAQQENKED